MVLACHFDVFWGARSSRAAKVKARGASEQYACMLYAHTAAPPSASSPSPFSDRQTPCSCVTRRTLDNKPAVPSWSLQYTYNAHTTYHGCCVITFSHIYAHSQASYGLINHAHARTHSPFLARVCSPPSRRMTPYLQIQASSQPHSRHLRSICRLFPHRLCRWADR